MCGIGWSSVAAQHPQWLESGFARIIAQLATKGHPTMDKMGVPLAIDFAKTAEDRQVMELIYSQLIFGRPYVLPPGTPPDRVAALRKAFMAALRDPETLAEAKKMNLDLDALDGRGGPGRGRQGLRDAGAHRRAGEAGADLQAALVLSVNPTAFGRSFKHNSRAATCCACVLWRVTAQPCIFRARATSSSASEQRYVLHSLGRAHREDSHAASKADLGRCRGPRTADNDRQRAGVR